MDGDIGSVLKRLKQLVESDNSEPELGGEHATEGDYEVEGELEENKIQGIQDLIKSTADRVKDKGNLKSLRAEYRDIDKKINETEKKLDSLNSKISKLTSAKKKKQAELDSIVDKKTRISSTNAPVLLKQEQITDSLSELESDQKTLDESLSGVEIRSQQAREDLDRLKEKLEGLWGEKQRFTNQIRKNPKKIADIETKTAQMRQDIEGYRRRLSELAQKKTTLLGSEKSYFYEEKKLNTLLQTVLVEKNEAENEYGIFHELDQLNNDLSQTDSEITAIIREISDRKNARVDLLRTQKSLTSGLKFMKERVEHLDWELKQVEKEEERARIVYGRYTRSDDLEVESSKLKKDIDDLTRSLDDLQANHEDTLKKLEKIREELKPLQEKKIQISHEIDGIMEEKTLLERELLGIGGSPDELKIDLPESLKKSKEEVESALSEKTDQINQLEQQEKNIRDTKEEVKLKLRKQKSILDDREKQLLKIEHEIKTDEDPFGEEKKKAQLELENLRNRREKLENQLDDATRERANIKRRITSINKEVKHEAERIKQLQENLKKKRAMKQSLIEEQSLVKKKQQVEWAGENEVKQIIAPIKIKMDDLTGLKKRLQARIGLLNDEHSRYASQLDKLLSEKRAIRDEINSVDEETTKIHLNIEQLEQEIADNLSMRNTLSEGLHDCKLQVPFIESKIKNLEDEKKRLEDRIRQINALKTEIKQQKNKVAEKQTRLRDQMTSILSQVQQVGQTIDKLNRQYEGKHEALEKTNIKLITLLDEQKQLKQQHQTYLDQRILIDKEIKVLEKIYS
ncbi:MAG: hypothetical protein GF334_09270 [Candidatus Altiarchaeales archaeon]|nr:hypothetical protein [Candidatus Altiarchaeales archaeon]